MNTSNFTKGDLRPLREGEGYVAAFIPVTAWDALTGNMNQNTRVSVPMVRGKTITIWVEGDYEMSMRSIEWKDGAWEVIKPKWVMLKGFAVKQQLEEGGEMTTIEEIYKTGTKWKRRGRVGEFARAVSQDYRHLILKEEKSAYNHLMSQKVKDEFKRSRRMLMIQALIIVAVWLIMMLTACTQAPECKNPFNAPTDNRDVPEWAIPHLQIKNGPKKNR